jgi:SprT protein
MMMKQSLQEGLRPYLPENSLEPVMNWLNGYPVHMRITRGRATKLGDYRPPQRDHIHRISINGNLNQYEFLITLTHEIAHLAIWEKYRKKVRPHGKAWKNQYASMLAVLLSTNIFPEDVALIIRKQVENPRASSKCDTDLTRILHEHNKVKDGIFLEDLPVGAFFYLQDGRKFQKQEKLRKWYRCIRQDTKRPYRISPVAKVVPAEN